MVIGDMNAKMRNMCTDVSLRMPGEDGNGECMIDWCAARVTVDRSPWGTRMLNGVL